MKTFNILPKARWLVTITLLLSLSVGQIWATTVTYTVSTATAVTSSGTAPTGSSASLSGTGSLNSGFIQCTNGKSHTLTLTGYDGYKITAITINVKSNSSKGTGSFSVVAGSTEIASIAESAFNTANWNGGWSTSGVDKELTMTDDAYEIQEDENVTFTISCKSGSSNYNSLYISSWAITYEAVGGGTPTHTLSSAVSPSGTGSVSLSSTTVAEGSTATATATPNSGYLFSSWSISGTGATLSSTSTNPTTVTMGTANATVTATFVVKNCTDHGGTNVTSQSGTAHAYGPVSSYYNYSTRQVLYTKTDLDLGATKKGSIKSIYFKYGYGTAMTKKTNVTIYMANTHLTALSNSSYVPYSEFTQVYTGSLNCSGNGSWNEITLNTPFEYNGVGNLVVMIDDNSGDYDGNSYVFGYHTANTLSANYAQLYNNSDSNNEDPSTTDWSNSSTYSATNYRPSTKFCIEEKNMEQSTVTWVAGSNPSFNSQTDYEGTALSDPGTPSAASYCPGGKVFVGWTATPIVGEQNAAPGDLFKSVSGKDIPVGGATYYAVFATESDGGDVTDVINKALVDAANSSIAGGSNGTWYTTTVDGSNSEARYFIRTMGRNNTNTYAIRWNSNGYLYCSTAPTSGLKLKSITATTTSNKSLNLYGSTSVYDAQATATSLGSLSATSSGVTYSLTSAQLANNYTCVGINGAASSTEVVSISITYSGGKSYSEYATTCCTPLASINGSFSFTSVGTTGATANWGWTGATTGISKNILKVYKESDNSLVATIDNISASATSQSITGLDPCTEYYVKLSTVSSGGGYCDGVADQTGASHVTFTTNGWGVSETLSHTNHESGASTACPASNYVATYSAEMGYVLPSSVAVSIGGVAKTQGTHYTWSVSNGTGTLTVLAANITTSTGAIAINISSDAAGCSGQYTFAYGATPNADGKNIDGATLECFSRVGETNEYQVTGFTIPTTTQYYWVGYNGAFYNDGLGSNNASSSRNQFKYMPVANLQGSSCGGTGDSYKHAAAGAYGTLRIYSNYSDNNLYVGFVPAGYFMRYGTTGQNDWANIQMSQSGSVWTTEPMDLTAEFIAKKFNIRIFSGASYDANSEGIAINNWTDGSSTISSMQRKTNSGENWASGVSAGMRGFFRTWTDNCANNGYCHFVPTHRVVFHSNYPGGGGPADTYSVDVSVEETNNSIALASAPSAPTGYTFANWYDAADGGNAVTTARTISAGASADIELWAHWNAIDYTVTVNQSPAAGATTTGQTSTAHYGGTINLTTTVPSGYRFVNWTSSDVTITNPTSATTASFTMPNGNVTVTANFQQTHTVDWYVGGSAVGNKLGDDGQTTVVDHGGKITNFPATTPDGSPCDKTFVGWTNTTSYVHGTSPLFTDVAGSPTINADASFYAVFATGGESSYVLVESDLGTNWAGDYLIAYNDTHFADGRVGGTGTGAIGAQNTSVNPGDNLSGKVVAASWGDTYYVTLEEISSGSNTYMLKTQDGKYNYQSSNANGCNPTDNKATASPYPITVGYQSSSDIRLALGGSATGAVFRYNTGGYFRYYRDCGQEAVYLYKKTGGYTGHTINCADCGTSVTPTYTASPTGGTVSVTKSAAAVASGSTVKTCSSVDLTVIITPASSHYTLTGFTATGLSTGTATISPAVNTVVPTTSAQTFTVTVSASATGTLNLTPTFTEDTKVAITWNVNGVDQSIAATQGLTWVYSGEDLTALPSTPSVPAGCSGTKVFAGWSQKHSDATEQDAAWYDDLFTNVAGAPTGIDEAKTFYAVFATSSSNPLAGTVMWDEPWTGTTHQTAPTSPSSGATVYNSTVLTYAYTNGNTTTQVYSSGDMYSGGAAAPELLISKTSPSGVWTVTNIPTGGSAQTELTLSYKTNKTTIEVTSGTSGITIGDATVDGNTYTHTITISHSPSTINNFSLIFTNTGSQNARIDDIHLVVPGSSSYSEMVTLCAPSYTITYDKNTSDPVTNLPSPTSVLQSTGSGTLSSTVAVRATYTLVGWSNSSGNNNTKDYDIGGSITGVTADKTIYAVWEKTAVEELTLNYSELNKYVGDPAVTLEVTGVTPDGADPSVTWSSNNTSVASVVAATGVVTFGTVGTATITATSTVTGTTTAYCYVTVRNKPTATFTDLIHDGNGTDLSDYNLQDVAGTAIVFPTLADFATPGDDCDSKHYVFVGWTTSDNNDDPEDHLVTSDVLEDDQAKTFYAVWADGVAGVSYTKMSNNSFKTSPTKYVIGVESGGDTYYLYDCASTDANNSWGYTTNAPGTNAPIQFTLSGTTSALVATSTEVSARYLTPLTAKNFQMSATSKSVQLDADGTIHNTGDNSGWNLRGNSTDLRWYNGTTGTSAYFYEVTAGSSVSYRTSCCTNNVAAPTVVATNTAYTVTLTWGAVDYATGYEVSWNGGAFEAATSPCVKSGLTASTDYTYKVRATYDPLVKCGALVASGNVTTDDVYTVTYSGGTGTGSCSPSGSVATVSYEAGATVTLAATSSYSMTSNTFAAWVVKDADDNDVAVSNNQFTMPAKNVTVTATWTAVEDKYYDRMHAGTDDSHGGVVDGEGKYYLVREGCNYTVPALTDDDDGETACHTTHFKLLGWVAASYMYLTGEHAGELKPGGDAHIFQGGGTKSATGATYYAVWAIMTE